LTLRAMSFVSTMQATIGLVRPGASRSDPAVNAAVRATFALRLSHSGGTPVT
jgi:hypothetical protein